MNTMTAKLDAVKSYLQHNPWLTPLTAFVFGVALGPGSLWSYASYGMSEKTYQLEKIAAENDLQSRLLILQGDILQNVKGYIEVRDLYFREDNKSDAYQVRTQYETTKFRMAKLIDDYNNLEAKLSILEYRQPRWFQIGGLIPPLPPRNLQVRTGSTPDQVVLTWEPPLVEPLLLEASKNLEVLFKNHGQKYSTEESAKDERTELSMLSHARWHL